MSVCLSVCPSVTSRSCTKTAKPRITLITLYYSTGTLSDAKNLREISTRSPQRGCQIEVGRFTSVIFDQYLAISQKRCKTGTQLLWKANMNSCALCQILNDFGWPITTRSHPIFDILQHRSYFRNGWRRTSNLVGRFTIACPNLSVTNRSWKRRGQGQVTNCRILHPTKYFRNG